MGKGFLSLTLLLVLITGAAQAADTSFGAWLEGFRKEALSKGISQKTIDAALTNITPSDRVIELDRKQPEWKKTFTQYREMIVNPTRVKQGRELYQAYKKELDAIGAKYGVAPQYIVALWGIETNYGSNTGGFKVVPALATLAWEGRRRTFFTNELINALKIIDEGHISASDMKGSWAGAMGQNQFMPSSFMAYAVDETGDGRRDIWGTERDIFASTANYLKRSGWTEGQRWGRRVQLPTGFSKTLEGREIKKPLSYWSKIGVRNADGSPLPSENITGSIVAPDGVTGEAFLVYNNFNVIMAWNKSTYFATSVGLLADQIAQ